MKKQLDQKLYPQQGKPCKTQNRNESKMTHYSGSKVYISCEREIYGINFKHNCEIWVFLCLSSCRHPSKHTHECFPHAPSADLQTPFLPSLVRGYSQIQLYQFFFLLLFFLHSLKNCVFEPLFCVVVIVVQEISVNKIKILAHLKQGARDPMNKNNKQVRKRVQREIRSRRKEGRVR